jgi:hypothetical protein
MWIEGDAVAEAPGAGYPEVDASSAARPDGELPVSRRPPGIGQRLHRLLIMGRVALR